MGVRRMRSQEPSASSRNVRFSSTLRCTNAVRERDLINSKRLRSARRVFRKVRLTTTLHTNKANRVKASTQCAGVHGASDGGWQRANKQARCVRAHTHCAAHRMRCESRSGAAAASSVMTDRAKEGGWPAAHSRSSSAGVRMSCGGRRVRAVPAHGPMQRSAQQQQRVQLGGRQDVQHMVVDHGGTRWASGSSEPCTHPQQPWSPPAGAAPTRSSARRSESSVSCALSARLKATSQRPVAAADSSLGPASSPGPARWLHSAATRACGHGGRSCFRHCRRTQQQQRQRRAEAGAVAAAAAAPPQPSSCAAAPAAPSSWRSVSRDRVAMSPQHVSACSQRS